MGPTLATRDLFLGQSRIYRRSHGRLQNLLQRLSAEAMPVHRVPSRKKDEFEGNDLFGDSPEMGKGNVCRLA